MAKITIDLIQRIEWQGTKEASKLNLLAIETSATACSVAMLSKGTIISLHEIMPMQQSKHLLPMVLALLDEASLGLDHIDAIAFGKGPGSFTGIRLAASTAQGLGYAAHKPLLAVSSLASLAQETYLKHQHNDLFVAVDAHMGQIYWAHYQVKNHQVIARQPDVLCLPEKIPKPAYKEGHGVGSGWAKYPERLKSALEGTVVHSICTDDVATAAAMLYLAVPLFIEGKVTSASDASPSYLR